MSTQWIIAATLDEVGGRYQLWMHATRSVDGKTETTSDMVMVDHPAEARMECARFADVLGVEAYTLDDRRKGAA